MVLPSFTKFYRVLPSMTGFYWVLLGFTGFYRVLLGFTWFCGRLARTRGDNVAAGVDLMVGGVGRVRRGLRRGRPPQLKSTQVEEQFIKKRN